MLHDWRKCPRLPYEVMTQMVLSHTNNEIHQVVERTRRWVMEVIVGFNLCPFAAKPVVDNTVRYAVSDVKDVRYTPSL